AIVVIEGDDAVDFGARDVQARRDHRQGLLRHMAERVLDFVQDRQQRSLDFLEILDDGRSAPRDLGTCVLSIHAAALPNSNRDFLSSFYESKDFPPYQYGVSVNR